MDIAAITDRTPSPFNSALETGVRTLAVQPTLILYTMAYTDG